MTLFDNFSKFLPKFVFLSKRKFNAAFVKFFEKYAKIMHFCYFHNKYFEIFRKFSGVRGLRHPPDPPRGRPPKVSPANRNPGGAAVNVLKFYLRGLRSPPPYLHYRHILLSSLFYNSRVRSIKKSKIAHFLQLIH